MSDHLRRHPVYASDFSFKRVALHIACLIRRPEKAAFFLAGIQREFSFLLQRC
ncbi:MAG: hypothetical protein WAK31_22130 [Chthoniobacterales bacterium]